MPVYVMIFSNGSLFFTIQLIPIKLCAFKFWLKIVNLRYDTSDCCLRRKGFKSPGG
jgi:hypothetical protein